MISRDTYDFSKNFTEVQFHQDRVLQDCELNDVQRIAAGRLAMIGGVLFNDGAVLAGGAVTVVSNQLQIAAFAFWNGSGVDVCNGGTLTYEVGKTSGTDTAHVEILQQVITADDDDTLINPTTGQSGAERLKHIVSLSATDTTEDELPTGATGRIVLPVFAFNRATGVVTRSVSRWSALHDDLASLGVVGNAVIGGTLGVTGAVTLSSTLGVTGAVTLSDDLAVNGGDITSTAATLTLSAASGAFAITSSSATISNSAGRIYTEHTATGNVANACQTSFRLKNSAGTALTFCGLFGASPTITAGAEYGQFAVSLLVNGATVYDCLKVSNGGDLAIKGGNISTNQTTVNLLCTTSTTVNFATLATALVMGAATGVTTVNNEFHAKAIASGAPSGGVDGEIAVRTDGIYQRRSGSWTKITS